MSDAISPPIPPVSGERSERPGLTLVSEINQRLGDLYHAAKRVQLQYPLTGEQERRFRQAVQDGCGRIVFGGIEFTRIVYLRDLDKAGTDDLIHMTPIDGRLGAPAAEQAKLIDQMVGFGWDIVGSELEQATVSPNELASWQFIWHHLVDILEPGQLRRLFRRNFTLPLSDDLGGYATPLNKKRIARINQLLERRRQQDRIERRKNKKILATMRQETISWPRKKRRSGI